MPMFTNPIGSKQLMKYADRIELKVDQRLALEPMHDSYLQIFRALRDEDMQEFIDILYDTMSGFVRNGFSIPQRSTLEQIVRDFLKVEKKIAAIDKSLFNEIASLLDEQQHFRLERVRKQRRIDALRTIILEIGGEFNSGAQIDLTYYVENLDLTDEEKALVNPILISYESTLLAKARKLNSAIKVATVTILDAIDELGLRDLEPQEFMQLGNDEEFQLSVKTIFDESSIEFQKAVFELSKLNLKTLRKLFQYLEPQNKQDLRDKYYQRVYRSAYSGTTAWRRRFDDALKLKSLPPELVEPITQTRNDAIKQQDVIIEKIVDVVEKSREYRTFDVMNDSMNNSHEQEIEELQRLSGSLELRSIQELESQLGPSLYAELTNENDNANKGQKQLASVVTKGNGRVVVQRELAMDISSHADRAQKDRYLSDPISPSEYNHYTSLLELETEDQYIVDILYQKYRENYDKLLYEPLHDEVSEDEEQQAQETNNAVSEDEIRQQRIDELQEIDNRLFDDVAMTINSEHQKNTLQRLRLLRTRTIYRKLINTYSPSWRDQQNTADLVQLLMITQIDGLEVNTFDEVLKSYESQTLPLLIERLEVTKKSNKRMDALKRANEAGASPAVSKAMMEKWQEFQQTIAKNHLQISQVSEEHLGKIKSQLPTNVAQQLQYSYNEIVYPRMFREAKDVDRTIKAALSMPNISVTQQSQIDVIADNFHNKYMKLAEIGINLQRELDSDRSNFSMGIPSRDMVMRELSREKLEFDRDEACDRAIMQLQIVLGETQRKALQEISKW